MGLDELEDLNEAWRVTPPAHVALQRFEDVYLRPYFSLPPREILDDSPDGPSPLAGVDVAALDAFMSRVIGRA
ncbi:MAG: hypothetical protein LUO93_09065 [Methanomicrobiales archaeon]|nr:hypothetical protein [Methanomicrobiales archaeon]